MAEGLIAATKEVKDLRRLLDDFLIMCSHKFQTANWTLLTSIPSVDLPTFAPLAIPLFDRIGQNGGFGNVNGCSTNTK